MEPEKLNAHPENQPQTPWSILQEMKKFEQILQEGEQENTKPFLDSVNSSFSQTSMESLIR